MSSARRVAYLASAVISILVARTVEAKTLHDPDSARVVAAVQKFHASLAASDSASVKRLLADNVAVLESGSLETRAEYLSHHLGADMEFAQGIRSDRKVVKYVRIGNAAWLISTSTTVGTFKGRAINSQGAELMVLAKTKGEWKIEAIHWSSARRQN